MNNTVNGVELALQLYKEVKAITQADKAETICKNSPYSQRINNYIHSGKELDLYKSLGLQEAFVTRPCLLININPYYITPTGKSNIERMAEGKAPFDAATGSVIDLHHINQEYDAPYAEVPHSIHDAPGINSMLHRSRKPSWRNDPQMSAEHNREVAAHWEKRAENICRTFAATSPAIATNKTALANEM